MGVMGRVRIIRDTPLHKGEMRPAVLAESRAKAGVRTLSLTSALFTYSRSSRVPSGRVRSHVPCINPSTHSPSALPPSSYIHTPHPCGMPMSSRGPDHVAIPGATSTADGKGPSFCVFRNA